MSRKEVAILSVVIIWKIMKLQDERENMKNKLIITMEELF